MKRKSIINNLEFDLTKGNFNNHIEHNNSTVGQEFNNTKAVVYSLNSKINPLSRSSYINENLDEFFNIDDRKLHLTKKMTRNGKTRNNSINMSL